MNFQGYEKPDIIYRKELSELEREDFMDILGSMMDFYNNDQEIVDYSRPFPGEVVGIFPQNAHMNLSFLDGFMDKCDYPDTVLLYKDEIGAIINIRLILKEIKDGSAYIILLDPSADKYKYKYKVITEIY